MKASSEVITRRRRILFAGFIVACVEDTRLPKCTMFGELVGGAGCVGGTGKGMDGMSPGRPQSFLGINADQWTTTVAAQDYNIPGIYIYYIYIYIYIYI